MRAAPQFITAQKIPELKLNLDHESHEVFAIAIEFGINGRP